MTKRLCLWFRLAAIPVILLGWVTPGRTHHSQSIYDREVEVTIRGRVTKYEWANPHVYVFVEQSTESGPVVWEIEAQPPAHMRRMGWSVETLAPGQTVIVKASPAVDRDRTLGLGRSLETADGTVLEMGFNRALLSENRTRFPVPEGELSGNWLTILNPVWVPLVISPESLELTEEGARAVENYNERAMHPGGDCVPYSSPFLTVFPDVKTIEARQDAILIRAEYEGVERVIHMDTTSHEGALPSLQGHSIGRWEGNVLVVETTDFIEHGVGIGLGLPSSSAKRLVERFEPNPDGASLTYRFELEDPVYLAQPYAGAAEWVYRPDLENNPVACDPENARRFWEY